MTHRENFLKANKLEDRPYSMKELSKISKVPLKILKEVYKRGIGAYKTQPASVRLKGSFVKGVNAPMSAKLSKEQWAVARVYSFLDGNAKHDNDLRLKGGMERANARSRASTISNDIPINRRTETGEYRLRRSDVERFVSPITGALMRTPAGYNESPFSEALFRDELPDRELPPPPVKKAKVPYPKGANAMVKATIDSTNSINEYAHRRAMAQYNREHGLSGRGGDTDDERDLEEELIEEIIKRIDMAFKSGMTNEKRDDIVQFIMSKGHSQTQAQNMWNKAFDILYQRHRERDKENERPLEGDGMCGGMERLDDLQKDYTETGDANRKKREEEEQKRKKAEMELRVRQKEYEQHAFAFFQAKVAYDEN